MRLFYLLGLFFLSIPSIAQLSISPSVYGPSYVFINDEILYVKKGLQLEKNSQGPFEASLYLREEAQLIQGEKGENENTGTGFLSVFQEGTSNAFDYNYWCLPVNEVSSSKKEFGALIFEPLNLTESRPAVITSGYEGLASPLTISRRWIYKFAGDEYADWEYIGDSFNLQPGEGFTMKGVNGSSPIVVNSVSNNPGNNQRYDFRGKPNDGEIELRILEDQSILTGNPYPSALDLKNFLLENTNCTGIAYFWDSMEHGSSHYLKDYEGGYGAYSPGANAYAPAVFEKFAQNGQTIAESGNQGQIYGREFCPVGQGFMLVGTSTGKIIFKNSYRIFQRENPQNSQFKMQQGKKALSAEIPNLRLNVELNNKYTRQLILAFNGNSTKGKDRAMDAENFSSLASDAGWHLENESYVINVQPFEINDQIPLILQLEEDGEAGFSIASFRDMQPLDIFIYDSEEKSFYNITTEEWRIQLPKGIHSGRFYLTFTDPSLALKEESPEDKPGKIPPLIDIFQNNSLGQLEINLPDDLDLKKVSLHNLNGARIFERKISEKEKHLVFSTSGLRDAVYILEVITTEDIKIIKKLGVKN